MVDDDDLSDECFCDSGRVVCVAHDLASANLILCNTADVEPNVVSGFSFGHSDVVRLDRLALADFARGHEDDFVPVLQHSRLDPSNWDSPDSCYGVDVHLVDGYNQLFNAESPSEVRVFPRLTSGSNCHFEFSLFRRNYEYSNICLASPCNHVLDEVTVSRRIDNRVEVMRSLEFLE